MIVAVQVKDMKVRAAVAFEAGKALQIEGGDLAGPKAGEVMVAC